MPAKIAASFSLPERITPNDKPLRRTRAARPKSKTGCGTCKKRHKKCDEARPLCNTCLTKGYKCDGYADSPPPPSPRSTPEPVAETSLVLPKTFFQDAPSVLPGCEPLELEYLDAFQRLSVPQLSGAFNDDFFSTFILRAAPYNPAVRHALVAVGALHSEAERGTSALHLTWSRSSSNRSAFILEQYGKALGSVVKVASKEGRRASDLVLSVCLLCILFESLRGNYAAAQMHTQSGVSLLLEVFADQAKSSPVPRAAGVPIDALVPLLMRLDLQASDPSDHSAWNRVASVRKLFEPRPVPAKFVDVEQSKRVILDYEYHFMIELRGAMQVNGPDLSAWPPAELDKMWDLRSRYEAFLNAWSAAQSAFFRDLKKPLDCQTRRCLRLLSVNHLWISTIVARFPSVDEVAYDDHRAAFVQILRIAEPFLHEGPLVPAKYSFSFDLGLSEPLFWVVMKCRDPTLRRHANELLGKCPIREGMWNSQLAAMMGEKAIALEESLSAGQVKTAADVPQEARVQFMQPKFLPDQGCFKMKLMNKFGMDREETVDYNGIIEEELLSR